MFLFYLTSRNLKFHFQSRVSKNFKDCKKKEPEIGVGVDTKVWLDVSLFVCVCVCMCVCVCLCACVFVCNCVIARATDRCHALSS